MSYLLIHNSVKTEMRSQVLRDKQSQKIVADAFKPKKSVTTYILLGMCEVKRPMMTTLESLGPNKPLVTTFEYKNNTFCRFLY